MKTGGEIPHPAMPGNFPLGVGMLKLAGLLFLLSCLAGLWGFMLRRRACTID